MAEKCGQVRLSSDPKVHEHKDWNSTLAFDWKKTVFTDNAMHTWGKKRRPSRSYNYVFQR